MEEGGPDLSHLTPEERAIIESVMIRQKQEEEREQEILRYLLVNDLQFYEIKISCAKNSEIYNDVLLNYIGNMRALKAVNEKIVTIVLLEPGRKSVIHLCFGYTY